MRYTPLLKSTTQRVLHLVWPHYAGRIRQGLARGMRSPDALGFPLLSRRPSQEERLLQSLDWRNQVIYDIGAHVGGFTMFFAARSAPHGKVYSFEPAPANYERLLANLRTNHLHNVRAFQVGIGADSSWRRLRQRGEDSGTFVLESPDQDSEAALESPGTGLNQDHDGEGGKAQQQRHLPGPQLVLSRPAGLEPRPAAIAGAAALNLPPAASDKAAFSHSFAPPQPAAVRVEALDVLVPRLQLPWPNFIKIDVEGMELEALQGMHQLLCACRPRLFVEMHGSDEAAKLRNAEQVSAFLLRHDYSIVHVESRQPVTAETVSIAARGHLYCTPRLRRADEMRWAA